MLPEKVILKIMVDAELESYDTGFSNQYLAHLASDGRTDEMENLELDELKDLFRYIVCFIGEWRLRDEIEAICMEVFPQHCFYGTKAQRIVEVANKHCIPAELFCEMNYQDLMRLRKVFMNLRNKQRQSNNLKAARATHALLKEMNIKTSSSPQNNAK